ncbi:ImuA family protein [Candidatus Filomicrobium marinum]|nr:hypothetical protein [Candidatus Filomicrobium marinum]
MGSELSPKDVLLRDRFQHAAETSSKITALRGLIAATERHATRKYVHPEREARLPSSIWCTGVPDIDGALPEGGLSREGVHEFSGEKYADMPVASAYLLAVLRRFADLEPASPSRYVLWCQTVRTEREFGAPYGAGLREFGFDPQRFLFVSSAKNNDVLWALEEGARAGSLLAVIGEVDTISFTQTRRLSLAAAAAGTPVLLLRSDQDRAASAAETRWRVQAASGVSDRLVSTVPGHARWQIALNRCHGGRPGNWTVEWEHEAHCFRLVEDLCARSSEMAEAQFPRPCMRLASG